jgi:CMP/dCMP kinase
LANFAAEFEQEIGMATVTVSRELGSGGDRVAARAAERLGFELVDRRLIDEVATITGATAEEVARYDEKGERRVQFFLRRLLVPKLGPGMTPVPVTGYFPEFGLDFPYIIDERIPRNRPYLDRGTYQLLITTLVQDAGATGRAVIVGRASQIVLARLPGSVHVKITCPLARRCEQLMESRQISHQAALRLAEQHDRWRKLYLLNHHGVDWDDPLLYDLVINTGRVSEGAAVEMITGLLNSRAPELSARPDQRPNPPERSAESET